ncbi:MAG: hypothetical protein IJ471_01615 [Eubacterium sp.]|nr:hypothetical protein [Eubacterium sp.]
MSKTKFLVYWDPYEEDRFSWANYFLDLFEKEPHVVTIDLKNNKDPRSQSILREADLVVVFLRQDENCLDKYFIHDLVRNENVIYVITDYLYDGLKDWPRILERYRIPKSELFVLPFSHRLQLVSGQDGLHKVIDEESRNTPYEMTVGFSKSYRMLREKIYQSLR